jgi:glucose-6-phosphate 1-epimerase
VAVITLHGAHVVSWIPAGAGERLYLSERSRFEAGRAIRGGIPVIFPQFGDGGPLQIPAGSSSVARPKGEKRLGVRHGFARISTWTLVGTRQDKGFACATLRLTDSEETRAIWPHAFAAELSVMIEGKRLDVEFEVENTGGEGFAFNAALHSYFSVAKTDMCRLQGLEGRHYLDQLDGGKYRCEDNEALSFDDEVDRIYLSVRKPLLLWEPARHLAIEAEGFPEVVVWNPWQDKCAAMDDMPPMGFRQMLCVEAATVVRPVELAAGERWLGRQTAIAL